LAYQAKRIPTISNHHYYNNSFGVGTVCIQGKDKVLLQKQSNLHYDGKPLRSITEVNKFLIVLASAVLMAFIFSVV
jgi:hypothetical protein